MTINEYNEQLLSLWTLYQQKGELPKGALYPIQYDEKERIDQKLLVIGCNPSFSGDKAFKSILAYERLDVLSQKKGLTIHVKTKDEKIDQMESLFSWNTESDPELVSAMKFLVSDARRHDAGLDYYTKFREIAKYVGFGINDLVHIDIFGWHRTKQKEVKNLATKTHVKFFNNQFKLFCELLNSATGVKVVLFNNAFASSYFAENCRNFGITLDDSQFDQKGYDMIMTPRLSAPIFFSGMLSGQRALDIGSLRRLKWQMKQSVHSLG